MRDDVMTADDLIRILGLQPLPWEGGYYRETWRARHILEPVALSDAYSGARSAGTAIYYLLTPDTISRMHRLPSDETFHFYLGDAVEMLLLHPPAAGGAGEVAVFGPDIAAGQLVQFTVPGNTWMGARLKPDGRAGYALMGTTVSPGFDFGDLGMGTYEELSGAYAVHAAMIADLT